MKIIEKLNPATKAALPVLLALSGMHMLNDIIQSTVSASYPMLKADLGLSFAQIGMISLIYQLSASVFQPLVGLFFDRHPFAGSLWLATTFSMLGLLGMAFSNNLVSICTSVSVLGIGSSIIHPEASRITSLASGGKRGFAQSIFQVGGNFGGSIGPLLVALLVAPYTRERIALFAICSLYSYFIGRVVYRWYKVYLNDPSSRRKTAELKQRPLNLHTTILVIFVICVLIISKYIYLESLRSYYTFYLIDKFGISIQASQIFLFVFLFATAAGTLAGGPLGDRIGRKYVILISILGTAPFSLAMPHSPLWLTVMLSFCAGFVLSSAFPAILLYAQELLPNRLGLVSGIFFGFAFGVGGIVSAILGNLIDSYGISTVYNLVCFSPLIGLVAVLLPDLAQGHHGGTERKEN